MENTEQIYDWHFEEQHAERVDKFLTSSGEDWSRSQVQQWIKEGYVQVNGHTVKANYKLQEDDYIHLRIPPVKDVNIEAEPMALDVVYEDPDVIVVNKPRGLVVHPAPGHYTGTLVNGLMAHCQDLSGINGVMRPGIVHRIDKDTSGLLMVAKNDQAHMSLADQLKAHTVTRRYVAIVHGVIGHDRGTVRAPIGRDPQHRQQMTVIKQGKEAVTHFHVKERYNQFTLVELQLETGRTHQIRVHMKYIGHPLAGDPKYGPSKTLSIQGQALHAKQLGFTHPRTGERLEFDVPVPSDMEKEMTRLRRN
ncbi:RluA family pseudouridine synthase [Caldalkalibacillus salinus]|uniref:RluA family pseudouridine synthase n=1 Tax=Caldalkalibacillus salinus TaxID=2803787 RepID=UPI0019207316|nr:RluA family pseudouridine synthase [Caldalkalibacillus salinus]